MGATEFLITSTGSSPKEAFKNAVEDALYEYGHRGYTGTIAEKTSFKTIVVPAGLDPVEYAEHLLAEDDPLVANKLSPACCIKLSKNRYLFFGYASS